MPTSNKKRAQVKEAITKTSMTVMDQFMPAGWIATPPEDMDPNDKRVFDAITEFEIMASRIVDEALAV